MTGSPGTDRDDRLSWTCCPTVVSMKGRLLVAGMACAGLALSGCAGGGGDQVITSPSQATGSSLPSIATPAPDGSAPVATPAAPTRSGAAVLPSVSVDDVGAGTKVDLASLSPSSQPLLVWMWAPH